jgi:hypothetical protein
MKPLTHVTHIVLLLVVSSMHMQYPVFVPKYAVRRVFYTSFTRHCPASGVLRLDTGTVVVVQNPGHLCYRDVCRDAMEPMYPELEGFEDVL